MKGDKGSSQVIDRLRVRVLEVVGNDGQPRVRIEEDCDEAVIKSLSPEGSVREWFRAFDAGDPGHASISMGRVLAELNSLKRRNLYLEKRVALLDNKPLASDEELKRIADLEAESGE